MQANEFIKKFGLDRAKDILNEWSGFTQLLKPTHFDSDLDIFIHANDFVFLDESDVSIIELLRSVKSHELVFEHGSIARAMKYAESPYTAPEFSERLLQAIKDVENCL